jgi:hypothetical protein
MVNTQRYGMFLSSYLVDQFTSAASHLKDIWNNFISACFELVSYPSIIALLTSTEPRLAILVIARETLCFAVGISAGLVASYYPRAS